nr:uncharacterized protein LOC111515995 [Leptinotarsa decemlineata]
MSIDNLSQILGKLNLNNENPSADSSVSLPNSSSSSNIIMANQFNSEYLRCVPEFDGNPNDLNRYLAVCDSIINTFYNVAEPTSFQNVYLLNCLISKLSGNAKVVANIQNVSNWRELKDTLTRNFADQRDETCLNRDMVMLRQSPNEKPQQFYDRCLNILNLLCNYIDVHEITQESKRCKRDLYSNLALKTFLSGLKEPLGTTIRCMQPKSLSEALQFVLQEDNVHYFQNFSNKNTFRPNFQPSRTPIQIRQPNSSPVNNYSTPNNFFRQQNQFPSQPIPIQPRAPSQPQKFFTNAQVFRQPFQNRNVFRPNQNQNFTKPTPMSVSTRNTYQTNKPVPMSVSTRNAPNYRSGPSNSFQNQPQRNFISEELFNTVVSDTQNEPNYSEHEYYAEEDYNEHYDEFLYCENENQESNFDNSEVNFQEMPTTNNQT